MVCAEASSGMSDAIDPEACPCYVRGLRGEDGDHAIDCVVGPLEAKLEAAERNAKYTDAYVVAASIEVPNLRERLEAAERERDGALAQWGNFAETCAGMGVKPSTPMRLREHLEGLERERDEAVKLLRSAEGIIEEELEPMNPQPDGQGLTPAAQEIVDWLAAARAFLAAQEKAQ